MCVFKRFNRKTQIWQYEFLLHIFMCFFNLSCAEHNCLIIVTVAETSSLKVSSQALQYGFTFIWMLTCKSTDSEIAESTFHSAVCILMCVFKWLFNKKSHTFNYKEGCRGACALPFRHQEACHLSHLLWRANSANEIPVIPLWKKVLEREGLEIGHLRGNLTSGHNTCVVEVQGGFFDWSPQKSLSVEILYENT